MKRKDEIELRRAVAIYARHRRAIMNIADGDGEVYVRMRRALSRASEDRSLSDAARAYLSLTANEIGQSRLNEHGAQRAGDASLNSLAMLLGVRR